MALIRTFLLLFSLLASAAPGFVPVVAAEAASEHALRAALLFNFIKFTEWPTAAGDAQLRVCVATSDPAQMTTIEALGDRKIHGMSLAVVRFNRQTTCNVVYVDSPRRWNEIADKNIGGPVLTIGGYAGFVADGGMIEIFLHEGSARFDIGLLEAKRAGLRIYPQLLRLARRIVE